MTVRRRNALLSPATAEARPSRAYALLALRISGVTGQGINRLIRLRRLWGGRDSRLDGYTPDARALFARWLCRTGRLVG